MLIEMDQVVEFRGQGMDQIVSFYRKMQKQMDNPRRDEDWQKEKKKKKTLRSHRRGR